MKVELRECVHIDSGVVYLFHAWIKKNTSNGEMLIGVVEDTQGILHEFNHSKLKFIS